MKAWVISVNMGYGHQRTAWPLRKLAPDGKIISANSYEGIPGRDRKIWEGARKFYEFISRIKRIPAIGELFFSLYDKTQRIPQYYPKRDLSKPTLALKKTFSLISQGWGEDLIKRLKNSPIPIVSTFFVPAFMAEFFNYPSEIFCVICDADISRSWVSLNPKKSRIKYFVPTHRVAERLSLYGVKKENIFLTGYPLPLENIGGKDLKILKNDLRYRLLNLDPQLRYYNKYKTLIRQSLGSLPEKPNHPLTIMFSIGGAGAQKEIGMAIIRGLRKEIGLGKVKIVLSVGIKKEIAEYFRAVLEKLFTRKELANMGGMVKILYQRKIEDYFKEFNQALRTTDILWTKPSELSFYSALGLPIIIAPPIGSQEVFNRRWLLRSGFGLLQEDPKYVCQWLFDWLNQGYLAECAMEGFIEGEKLGVFNIYDNIQFS